MINIFEATKIHDILIDRFGGTPGLRDKNLLESVLLRPYQTFDKKELYKSPIEKAAALIESIITNHPFIDGNKRFGYVAMRLLLLENNLDIKASETDKYEFVILIAKGELKFKEICNWIEKNKRKSN
jgi:death-on-curing protein